MGPEKSACQNEFQKGPQKKRTRTEPIKKVEVLDLGGGHLRWAPCPQPILCKADHTQSRPLQGNSALFWVLPAKPLGIRLCSETCSFFFFLRFGGRKKKKSSWLCWPNVKQKNLKNQISWSGSHNLGVNSGEKNPSARAGPLRAFRASVWRASLKKKLDPRP